MSTSPFGAAAVWGSSFMNASSSISSSAADFGPSFGFLGSLAAMRGAPPFLERMGPTPGVLTGSSVVSGKGQRQRGTHEAGAELARPSRSRRPGFSILLMSEGALATRRALGGGPASNVIDIG